MGCLPCTGLQLETQLLNDCYPPPKALVNAGPEYKPLSQDLSKLTYRCTNQSSKLAKVGEELEKRVVKEAIRSTGGYQKSRASLLISLAILRALISECRRDLSLFSRNIVRIVNASLDVKVYQKGELDLEVIGRAASCFVAFTTYTDGNAVGVDDSLNRTFLDVLRKFGAMAVDTGLREKPDEETQNRTRLTGLAALNGASASDAMFASNSEFSRQISYVIPALLTNLFEGSMANLKLETAKLEMDASPSPFFSEFSARRPVIDRRAPSLHAHIPGDKGPSQLDVLSAALRSLHALVGQCQVNQASIVLDSIFAFLDKVGWHDVERCCWLAERMTSFTSLQYRFVVPTCLVELLTDIPDHGSVPKHRTVLAMITTILNSSVSLVGLGIADLLSSLLTLTIRRIQVHPQDALLPALVQCIAALGTHIYYADQINDTVEEIGIRMSELAQSDSARPEILRVLTCCIIGLMKTAVAADAADAEDAWAKKVEAPESGEKGKAPHVETPGNAIRRPTTRRNPISVQVWQETLPLLCESKFAIRITYARALLLFLEHEIPRDRTSARTTDITILRFCHAVNAALYTLAMSSCLGVDSSESVTVSANGLPVVLPPAALMATPESKMENGTHPDSAPAVEGSPGSPGAKGVSFNVTGSTPSGTPQGSTGNASPPKKNHRTPRRVSLPLNRVNSSAVLTSFDNVATPLDFAMIIRILDDLHQAAPNAALLTGVPMLLALDRDAGLELVRRPNDGRHGAWINERRRAIREVVALVWRRLGDRWGVSAITDLADKALNTLPEPFEVPDLTPTPSGTVLPPPEEPVSFVRSAVEGESSSATLQSLDPEIIVSSLANSTAVQNASDQDAATLTKHWTAKWSVEVALQNSVERFSSSQVNPASDTHFDVATALMSMNQNNASMQSFSARSQTRPIDVTDLREALGGRPGSYQGSSPPSLTSTGGAPTLRDEGHRRRLPSGDVKDVLKEIFKDKNKKRGPGRRGNILPIAPSNT